MNNETDTSAESLSPSMNEAQAAPSSNHVSRPGWMEWIRHGLRASALRPIHDLPSGPSTAQMFFIWSACILISIALQRAAVGGDAEFSFASWLYQWSSTGLSICGCWLIVNRWSASTLHASPVAAWVLVTSVAGIPISLVYTLAGIALRHDDGTWSPKSMWIYWGSYLVVCVWSLAATWRVALGINRVRSVAVGLVLLTAMLTGLQITFLNFPVWQRDYHSSDNDTERKFLKLSQEVFESQRTLLNDALRAIESHRGNTRQVYGVVYAPYFQDVFLRESAMVQEVLEQTFGAAGRVVRLVNHPDVTAEIPWATNLNLERSLTVLAGSMDTERDVLVLYLTSHGGADFALATQYYPLEVEELQANQLREMLDKSGIRNRVIVISACYSGGWIEPLSNDNTLVMTAADKDHTSYGCGSKSELTYFGRALFDEQLRKTNSFEAAFNAAIPIIREREIEGGKDDGFSNPQISVGKEIKIVLEEWAEQRSVEKNSGK